MFCASISRGFHSHGLAGEGSRTGAAGNPLACWHLIAEVSTFTGETIGHLPGGVEDPRSTNERAHGSPNIRGRAVRANTSWRSRSCWTRKPPDTPPRCDLKELTSMALDPQKLDEIIRSGDVAACVAFFRGASEAERKKVAKVAVNHLRELTTRTSMPARLLGSLARTQIGPASAILTQVDGLGPAAFQVIRVAVLASAPLSKWRSLGLEGMPPELVDAILTDRRPPWLVEAIDLLMGLRPPFNTDYWPIVRRMIRDGLCQAPTSTTYLETMIATLPATSCERKEDLKTLLLEDPGLLDHEIWRIFESEPRPGSIQLLSYYNSGDLLRHSWEHALVELARDGTIPRTRLLDATLDGLERDFHDQRARWFAALHERLDPTTSEQAGFVGRYLALLGSRNPSTVNFALAVAKHLDTAEQLDPAVLIASITPALRARTIRTVNLALELLDLATRRAATSPARSQAALVAVEALVHEAPVFSGRSWS